jgi:hypothetical protein
MQTYNDEELAHHHTRCYQNRERVAVAGQCGCFQWLEIFLANELTAYTDHATSGYLLE